MPDILAELNPAQRQAVVAPPGPLLILAGPGSGKTRVIAHRVAYLIQARGVSPRRIMAVTFTNKAAREMKERLNRLLGPTALELTVGTFHAICARILRQDGAALGLDRSFVIYDDDEQRGLVKESLVDLGLDPKQHSPGAVLGAISAAKSQLMEVEDFRRRHAQDYFQEVVGRVYERYQERLRESKALDFDDLLMGAVQLFQRHPPVLARYQERYQHLLVDEFQDTNLAQYALARLLAGGHRHICVVGDPDQSIYSWRSADIRNILSFERDFPGAQVVYLEQNYRSTQTVLQAAHAVIAKNKERKEKQLWTENAAGPPIMMVEAYDEKEEAQWVALEVERLLSQEKGGQCAVMYRTNAQSRPLEEAFLHLGLPYQLVGGTRFYERREVRDVVAYLRLAHNPYDSASLARVLNVPPRGIGAKTIEDVSRLARQRELPLYAALQLAAAEDVGLSAAARQRLGGFLELLHRLMAAAKELAPLALLNLALERTAYRQYLVESEPGRPGEERWENLLELRGVAEEYGEMGPGVGLEAFLERVALHSDTDELGEKPERVTLITLHQAKGLEFPAVFIVGLEEGILPHSRSFDDPAQMEEERRLFYVGMTRAQERLYLVRAFRRRYLGASTPRLPSRYLADIPALLTITPRERGRAAERPAAPAALAAYRAGEKVRHAQFGDGIVVAAQPARDDLEVTIAFKGQPGVRKFLASLAQLEKTG
ncbi:MAG: UvrD-helicase domain-containing protein [Chloroflexi bacterium]|nr:UvrD-helicase domain-containing protein [Chloroflexota bacterium]